MPRREFGPGLRPLSGIDLRSGWVRNGCNVCLNRCASCSPGLLSRQGDQVCGVVVVVVENTGVLAPLRLISRGPGRVLGTRKSAVRARRGTLEGRGIEPLRLKGVQEGGLVEQALGEEKFHVRPS